MKRLSGKVAGAEARYITGVTLAVDAGYHNR